MKPPRIRSSLFYGLARAPFASERLQDLFLFKTGQAPHFEDEEATSWFLTKLQASKKYLEYGSGGTTFAAAQLGKPFVSKESDLRFLRSVAQTIERAGLTQHNQTLLHADIGLTESWGYPGGIGVPDQRRLKAFDAYSDFPQMDQLPDLILIDGRFRVASLLKTVRALRGRSGWTIVFDDYDDRPHYHSVEQFAKMEKRVGRMAVFTALDSLDLATLDQQIDLFRSDPR